MKIKRSLIGVTLAVAALVLAACGGSSNPLGEASSPEAAQPSASSAAGAPIVVGSADFTESKILAEIYSQALQAKGIESSTKLGIGSREIYIKALQDQSISAVPEYTGKRCPAT
jgi:osmoprotectant transport system substrate-binding protein